MPAAHLLGGMDSGHDCHPPRANVQASPNVIIEGTPVHRVGDMWAVHCCGISCHSAPLAEGSGSVMINGKGCARIGDKVGCGSVTVDGASTVFVGD